MQGWEILFRHITLSKRCTSLNLNLSSKEVCASRIFHTSASNSSLTKFLLPHVIIIPINQVFNVECLIVRFSDNKSDLRVRKKISVVFYLYPVYMKKTQTKWNSSQESRKKKKTEREIEGKMRVKCMDETKQILPILNLDTWQSSKSGER